MKIQSITTHIYFLKLICNLLLQMSMQGYIDNNFHSEQHPNCKRVKNVAWQIVQPNQIQKVVVGPLDDIDPNAVFLVIPGCQLSPLNRFAYLDPSTKTITVPLVIDYNTFLNSNMVLFTLVETNMDEVWKLLREDDIFWSDYNDTDDEAKDEAKDDEEEERMEEMKKSNNGQLESENENKIKAETTEHDPSNTTMEKNSRKHYADTARYSHNMFGVGLGIGNNEEAIKDEEDEDEEIYRVMA